MDLVNLIEKKVKKKVNYKIKEMHNKELFITKANINKIKSKYNIMPKMSFSKIVSSVVKWAKI